MRRGRQRMWRGFVRACVCAWVCSGGQARAQVAPGDAPAFLAIERLGDGAMLVARHGDIRLTIPRAGPRASRGLLGHWAAQTGDSTGAPREVLVVPQLSSAAGAVPRAVAGEDGAFDTDDDVVVAQSLLPGAALDSDNPIHRGLERALRSSEWLPAGETTCLGGRDPAACIVVRSWHRAAAPGSSAISLCVEAAGQVVWVPGGLGATEREEGRSACPQATVLWVHEAALEEALAGSRTWIDELREDLIIIVSPEGADQCVPRYSSLQALAPRTVVVLAQQGLHNTGACAGRVDTGTYAPVLGMRSVRWAWP